MDPINTGFAVSAVLLASIVLMALCWLLKPELLTLPYSLFLGLFVRNTPFPAIDRYFHGHEVLKDNWVVIRQELIEVMKEQHAIPRFHDIDDIQKFISAKDDIPWRTFGIMAFGRWIEPNASMVPRTAALLSSLPDVTLAMFSILGPGKHIPGHFGFFKGVMRYHLGLIVPDEGECYIVCGKQRYDWQEGEDVLFDDTYWHEVWNNTQETRVVLFLDIARGNTLPAWLRGINDRMIARLAGSKRIRKGIQRAAINTGT